MTTDMVWELLEANGLDPYSDSHAMTAVAVGRRYAISDDEELARQLVSHAMTTGATDETMEAEAVRLGGTRVITERFPELAAAAPATSPGGQPVSTPATEVPAGVDPAAVSEYERLIEKGRRSPNGLNEKDMVRVLQLKRDHRLTADRPDGEPRFNSDAVHGGGGWQE